MGGCHRLQRVWHLVQFARTRAEGGGRAKPAGVRGCQIWMKIGSPAPASVSELTFVTADTRTPHTIDFDTADGGKLVFYWCRWVKTCGQPGPGTPLVNATVAA